MIMVPPIEGAEITSVGQAKEAIKMGKITREEAKNIAQAISEIEKDTEESDENLEEMREKIPELEENTLKIKSTWRREEDKNLYDGGKIKIKVNPEGDVIEYLEGPAKWEQLFISYDAFIREACKFKNCSKSVLEKKYIPTPEKLILLAGNPWEKSEKYTDFYTANIKNSQLAGYFIPRWEKLGRVGERLHIWVAGGNDADFSKEKYGINTGGKSYGFSWLLLKD